jgi:hypothetical protein
MDMDTGRDRDMNIDRDTDNNIVMDMNPAKFVQMDMKPHRNLSRVERYPAKICLEGFETLLDCS